MKVFISPLLQTAFLSTALMVPSAMLAQHPNRYHDEQHNDDHEWNNHEDKAYRMWAKQNHRKYVQFNRLPPADQQNYWGWRHEHSDVQLHITL